LNRTEKLAHCLAHVRVAERWRDEAAEVKLTAEGVFNQAVEACHANGVDPWRGQPAVTGDEYREAPQLDKMLAEVREAHAGLDTARAELRTARARLSRAYRDLGRVVAS
jgi:hypothetical protein